MSLLFQVAVGPLGKPIATFNRVEVIPLSVVKLPRSGLGVDFFRPPRGRPRQAVRSLYIDRLLAYRAFSHGKFLSIERWVHGPTGNRCFALVTPAG